VTALHQYYCAKLIVSRSLWQPFYYLIANHIHRNQYASQSEFYCSLTNQQFAREEKEKPAFLVWRKNTATFKHFERLGYQQVFGYEQISQRQPFQEGGWTTQRGTLCSHSRTSPSLVENWRNLVCVSVWLRLYDARQSFCYVAVELHCLAEELLFVINKLLHFLLLCSSFIKPECSLM